MIFDGPTGRPERSALVLLTALSLSVGWGIRGNFGHEFGAMIPGALAAMAVALLAGRPDWRRRVAYFGMFGALGWSFGGSISYMQVVAYTHSGDSTSVLYGFACLFVIGFLWAAPGGAGTAFAAVADRERLTGLCAPLAAVLVAWFLEGTFLEPWLRRQGYNLNWFDTDWLGALVALVAVLSLALVRRRLDQGSVLILHMAIGWWLGFLLLVNVLGLRMTPPRGDNWAGCLGLTLGMLVYCLRNGLEEVARAALISGFIGGIGFAAASMLKLVEVTSGIETNWHSILEQTTGLFNGLGIAVAMIGLAARAPRVNDDPPLRRWTEPFAVGFVLLLITYLNLAKNPTNWVRDGVMPREMAHLATSAWFNIAYLLLALAILVPLVRHLSRPLPIVPSSWLGKGQLLYLTFLWWMVVGNFERELVGFTGQRLVTEGVIHLNAVICTLLVLLAVGPDRMIETSSLTLRRGSFARLIAIGLIAASVCIIVDWAIVRAIYGDRFAGHASLHIRFGPRATTNPVPRK
jgi:hypothetical protein